MQGVTLTIALAASALVFLLRPLLGLLIYVAAFAWYPMFLTVKVGTVDFTVARIVILALYVKIFLLSNLPSHFKLALVDKLVILYFVAQFVAGIFNGSPASTFIENRAGAMFDMMLPYFAVRLIITGKDEYLRLLKGIMMIAAPAAIVGFYESATGHNPFAFLQAYSAWPVGEFVVMAPRLGFSRAKLIYPHSIMLGLFFAMFGPICAGLLKAEARRSLLLVVGVGLMAIGVFASMSGGPWMATFIAVGIVAFFRYRRYTKTMIAVVIVLCGIVEIISNRHFYDTIGRYTFSGGSAWYRSRLIDVAFTEGGMSGHWLAGYGINTSAAADASAAWAERIDRRSRVDMVNDYLGNLFKFGLIGLLPFLAMLAAAVIALLKALKASETLGDTWLTWCVGCSLFGTLAAMNTTSLFGPPVVILYMMLAFCTIMPRLVTGTTHVWVERVLVRNTASEPSTVIDEPQVVA
jgi:hypothetical protein